MTIITNFDTSICCLLLFSIFSIRIGAFLFPDPINTFISVCLGQSDSLSVLFCISILFILAFYHRYPARVPNDSVLGVHKIFEDLALIFIPLASIYYSFYVNLCIQRILYENYYYSNMQYFSSILFPLSS